MMRRRQEVDPVFYILDARGQIAATVNMAAGKGTEDVSMYTNTELEFCNIENIHVMRSSYQAQGMCRRQDGWMMDGWMDRWIDGWMGVHAFPPISAVYSQLIFLFFICVSLGDMLSPPVQGVSSSGDSSYYVRLDDAGWTKHCRLLLVAAVKAAERLRLNRCSVLVHW